MHQLEESGRRVLTRMPCHRIRPDGCGYGYKPMRQCTIRETCGDVWHCRRESVPSRRSARSGNSRVAIAIRVNFFLRITHKVSGDPLRGTERFHVFE
jgi:hypothetical protein